MWKIKPSWKLIWPSFIFMGGMDIWKLQQKCSLIKNCSVWFTYSRHPFLIKYTRAKLFTIVIYSRNKFVPLSKTHLVAPPVLLCWNLNRVFGGGSWARQETSLTLIIIQSLAWNSSDPDIYNLHKLNSLIDYRHAHKGKMGYIFCPRAHLIDSKHYETLKKGGIYNKCF